MTAISVTFSPKVAADWDPQKPLTTTKLNGLVDNTTHLREWLGASYYAGAIQDHNHDGSNSNYVGSPGDIKGFSGTSAPPGWLTIPTAVTNISRTAYADLNALYAAAGYPWGAGDGSTTFGMIYCPVGYSLIQGGTVGSASSGQMPAHTHTFPTHLVTSGTVTGAVGAATTSAGLEATITTSSSGSGSINYGAGMHILMCVKY